jgi:hypothetical protein
MKRAWMGVAGLLLLARAVAFAHGPERWGDRDRPVIDFRVVRTRLVARGCEDCGYRRGEGGGSGAFRVETRIYAEWVRGRVIRTWREETECFDHCLRGRVR